MCPKADGECFFKAILGHLCGQHLLFSRLGLQSLSLLSSKRQWCAKNSSPDALLLLMTFGIRLIINQFEMKFIVSLLAHPEAGLPNKNAKIKKFNMSLFEFQIPKLECKCAFEEVVISVNQEFESSRIHEAETILSSLLPREGQVGALKAGHHCHLEGGSTLCEQAWVGAGVKSLTSACC